MTIHISARLAWHENGWNGKICQNPKANTYCIGPYSFPGDMIAERREIEAEENHAGEAINDLDKTVVALDIPSGLDCDLGEPLELAIRADHTITFAAIKKGFKNPKAAQYTGLLTVASIGINTTLLL